MYRYAPGDYTDAQCFPPPKAEGHNNNGYVPYVDYGRDYNPAFGKYRPDRTIENALKGWPNFWILYNAPFVFFLFSCSRRIE